MTDLHLGSLKMIAKVIEAKRPGTCTTLIRELDEVNQKPEYIRYRLALLKDKWDMIKDSLSTHEIHDITDSVGWDISDPNNWSSILDNIENASSTVDTVETSSGIISDIISFIHDIFS